MLFAAAGAPTDTVFDAGKHVIEKTFPRGFNLKSKRNAAGKVGKAMWSRNINNNPNLCSRRQGPAPGIARKTRGLGKAARGALSVGTAGAHVHAAVLLGISGQDGVEVGSARF